MLYADTYNQCKNNRENTKVIVIRNINMKKIEDYSTNDSILKCRQMDEEEITIFKKNR